MQTHNVPTLGAHQAWPELKQVDSIEQIPTPAMIIDVAVVEDNVRRMAEYAAQHQLKLRPHSKTHKLRSMGRLQMAHGAVGLTVAKAGEAEVMSSACDDLLLGYPVVDAHRAARIATLANQVTVRVAVDSVEAARALNNAASAEGSTIGILVDLDVGFRRTGVQNAAESIAIAQMVETCSHLRLDGLFFYPGQIRGSAEQVIAEMTKLETLLQCVLDAWKANGLEAAIVSGGSTPTGPFSHYAPSMTEIRPGTYIYNDVNCLVYNLCTIEQCAATIHTTVVSNAVPGKIIVDAGSKTLTPERQADPNWEGFGHVIGLPGAKIVRLTEEHGEIDISACDRVPVPGERLRIIPVHVCPSVNLHTFVWLAHAEGGYEPVPVDARGLVW